MKKGDLSMGVIIGATIALLILVIISVMIFRTGENISKGTSCESVVEGAMCVPDTDSCGEDYDMKTHSGGNCPKDYKCCIPI